MPQATGCTVVELPEDPDELPIRAVLEDFDASGEENIDVLLAQAFDKYPEMKVVWDNMVPVEHVLVRALMMGAMAFTYQTYSLQIAKLLEEETTEGDANDT